MNGDSEMTKGNSMIHAQSRSLVVDDREKNLFRVHRSAFTSEEIFRREQEEIFAKCWLYVGHESEIPRPNDFQTRRVGGRTVIYARDRDGGIQVMLNTCRHRGAEVCRERRGNRKNFVCFYHGWAYDNQGALINVPDGQRYSEHFSRADHGLFKPRTETYGGFTYLTYSTDAPPLPEYLGDAKHVIDLVADQSSSGMQIVQGTHNYSMRANWKLLMENSCDGYHGFTVHQTYFEMMLNLGVTPGLVAQQGNGLGCDLGNGHAVVESPELGMPLMSEEIRDATVARRAETVQRLGEPHTKRMLNTTRNAIIFPNMALIDLNFGIQVRTMFPLAPDKTEITGWQLMPADASDELKRYRIDNALTFWGPAGLATPDDVEGLEQCQRGFSSMHEVEWSDISRGLGSEQPTAVDELQMRCFWRQWNTRITGQPGHREGPHYDTSYLGSSPSGPALEPARNEAAAL
ncbi:aromatic-ring-hydroxylating dioxygenase subunit alpha [Mycobacterium saskatchewanense]|uniref:aromatic ring-hydroxylating oxygenase subunit alpha n=1 Tax=Mycobacterium saskatchewanense TaxID=220927 RepID=UPI00138D0146|nr:Rieske 2Fe-2S domain-containing protein [Mycobacterium saskatchewanense]BBX65189.1 aromatic-ring-hydroxylating dioxygenase subunit alpha [Mycobacterium saskatchewanense]